MGINIIHSDDYTNWVLGASHPTQGVRYALTASVLADIAAAGALDLTWHPTRNATEAELLTVHTPEHIARIREEHRCSEWTGVDAQLADLADKFFGGTMAAVDLITAGAKNVVHLAGAKHHAMSDHASGFCVYADFAAAAHRFVHENGFKVAVLDIDVHHGDGTEALTADEPRILTFSVHQGDAFPFSAPVDVNDSERGIFNRALKAGDGDDRLLAAVDDFIAVTRRHGADVIMVAMGADGHAADPLAQLEYSAAGFAAAVSAVRSAFPTAPMLLGGAGGYRPLDHTPEMWLSAICALAGLSSTEIEDLQLLQRVLDISGAQNPTPSAA